MPAVGPLILMAHTSRASEGGGDGLVGDLEGLAAMNFSSSMVSLRASISQSRLEPPGQGKEDVQAVDLVPGTMGRSSVMSLILLGWTSSAAPAGCLNGSERRL